MEPITVLARVCPSLEAGATNQTIRVAASGRSLTFASNGALFPYPRLLNSQPSNGSTFDFEQCFASTASNAEVFSVLSPQLLEASFSGVSMCIIAHGQTGTGKTYTMFGTDQDEGLISRMVKTLMRRIGSLDDVQVGIAHYEIYNESARDLLAVNGTDKKGLRVREDNERGVFVEGLTSHVVANEFEALEHLRIGSIRRSSAEVEASNYRTSCSHSVFEMEIVTTQLHPATRTCTKLVSKISFVDLAGHEKNTKSEARADVATGINSSLMTLRLVANALTAEGNQAQLFGGTQMSTVPFRNSLLTWLLRDSLGGRTKTIFLATLSSDAANAEETMTTLRLVSKLKSVVNEVSSIEHPSSISTRALTKEIQTLRLKLEDDSRQVPSSPRKKQSRFSMEALHKLNHQSVNYEEEIRTYKERALRAEKESRERAEVLWDSFQSLRNQLAEISKQVREETIQETKEALEKQEREEVESLVELACALTIQVTWRKYQLRKVKKAFATEKDNRRKDRARFEAEIQSLQEENSAMKIQSMQHYRTLDDLQEEIGALEKRRDMEVLLLKKDLEFKVASKDSELESMREQLSTHKADATTSRRIGSENEARVGDMKKLQLELDKAKDACKVEADKSSKARAEVERLKEEVENRDKQMKALQETIQQKRDQTDRDANLLRERVTHLEAMIEDSQAVTQRELEERQRKVSELETLIESLRQAEAESRRLGESETNALREQLKTVEANAVEELQRLSSQLKERGDEESTRAEQEVKILRTKIGTLEILLETNKAVTEKEVQERDRKVREIERLNSELEEREREEIERKNRELETMEFCLRRLQTELAATKASTSKEVQERDKKLMDLEKALNEQLAAQQKSVGASFMQYHRDSKQRHDSNRRLSTISVIPPSASTMMTMMHSSSSQQNHDDLLCVRVDVESFDERSALFYPCSSSVIPQDPTTRTFNVKSPLYDLKKSRWTRIRIKLLHGSIHRVDEVTNICLEHHLPGSRCTMHRLRVVKTERSPQGDGVQSVVCDWDASSSATAAFVEDGTHIEGAHQCFCFQRMEESGPMTLHATFLVDDSPVHWEYPLRFRNKTAVIEKIPGIGPKYLLSRRASDDIKHEYLNSSWFSLENESGNVRAGPVSDGKRIISFSGYLQKYQSHRGGKVQRWFVFAPPFLFCYQDATRAADDFTKARALPHSANRAMRVSGTTKVSVLQPKVSGVERVEFSIIGEDKTWHLQAANKEDLERWMNALTSWVAREQEINPAPRFAHQEQEALSAVDMDED